MTMHETAFTYDDGDIDTNRSTTPHLNTIISERYSRRQTLFGGLTAMSSAVFGSALLAGCGGGEELDSADLSVTAAASGPTASGRTVTLTGMVTGTAESVGWVQVSGPSVTLTNAGSNVATFIAPSVPTGTELTFRFTALSRGTPTSAVVHRHRRPGVARFHRRGQEPGRYRHGARGLQRRRALPSRRSDRRRASRPMPTTAPTPTSPSAPATITTA